jgi:hypothetical protein
VISPVNGLSCHRHLRVTTCKLDASVAASGPHDFAVCGKRSRPARSKIAPDACHIHRIPRPTCRDDRDTPLSIGARDGRISKDVLPDGESEKFLPEGLDFWTSRKCAKLICPSGKSLPGLLVGQCVVGRAKRNPPISSTWVSLRSTHPTRASWSLFASSRGISQNPVRSAFAGSPAYRKCGWR